MAETFISKRAIFPRGKQKFFILSVKRELNLSDAELAKLLKISIRTITDWKREKFSMSLPAVKILSTKSHIKPPEGVKIKNPFWYVNKGAKIGGIAVYKKYGCIGGNPEYRKKKWYEWWEKEGKYKNKIPIAPKPINKPHPSKDLAEFVGILLGDGGITQYQIKITLHYKDDKEYGKFIIALIKKLFKVPVNTYYRKSDSVVNLTVSRSELVRFCVKKLGLKQGNKIKQQVDIPNWIKRNKKYAIACLRGLMDTDGCVFLHHYKSRGKWYNYKKISFTSYSEPLRHSVFYILKSLSLKPRFAQRKDVRLDSQKDVKRYFKIIGSHNPKCLRKIIK